MISIIFYQIYFSDNKKIVQEEDIAITSEVQNQDLNSDETNYNVIQNLKYVSKDLLGNTYIVTAESAVIQKDKENEVKLNEVDAKIIKKK
ncbi:MAG: hypothetical protein ACJZ34_01715 [Candidatus Pelagibacter sp.]